MTHIKLCGMRRPEDIDAVNRLLPDYIGFIFAPKSRRYVTKDEAASLRKALDRRIRAVGVFVNAAEDEILVPVREGIIDDVQLHGVETPAMIRQLRAKLDAGGFSETRIIKAFSMTSPEDTAAALASPADLILLDSGSGGTGAAFDWALLKNFPRPFFLAGGLSPDNAAAALTEVRPWGLDVSSGIETDGFKDNAKMARFMQAVGRM
ncbi:MAG: phosphoribosylanthranilate isomerase [Lachnospiraceae bacterium]|nr:phosphoribosylanthranilate isomerase [Lachnospiraceae bacterium]